MVRCASARAACVASSAGTAKPQFGQRWPSAAAAGGSDAGGIVAIAAVIVVAVVCGSVYVCPFGRVWLDAIDPVVHFGVLVRRKCRSWRGRVVCGNVACWLVLCDAVHQRPAQRRVSSLSSRQKFAVCSSPIRENEKDEISRGVGGGDTMLWNTGLLLGSPVAEEGCVGRVGQPPICRRQFALAAPSRGAQ